MSTVPFTRTRTAPPLSPEIAKKLPSNLDAERQLLGGILVDNSSLKVARELVSPEDFFLEQNRRIFRNMLFLADSKQPIELVSVTENLTRNGELESAGGTAYIQSLMDGIPRVSNIAYYARLVKQKAVLRDLIHTAARIQQQALNEEHSSETIVNLAAESISAIAKPKHDNPAVVVGFKSLLDMVLPELEYSIEPLLTTGGTGEIYGWRGTGKSLVTTQIGLDLAAGRPTIFPGDGGPAWPVQRAYRVLYVYGEMHGSMIKNRARQLASGCGYAVPPDEFFGTMCKDFQKAWRPNISTPRNRKIIEERLFAGGYEVVIFDNISTLWPTSQENEGDRTAVLTEWFIDLNQRGVCVIYLHHAGKSGEQRGSSEKEDMLDFVLKLKNPANYRRKEGLRVEVINEKNRGECKQQRWLTAFELSLISERGAATWLTRKGRSANLEAAFELFSNGGKSGDAQFDLKISRATAFRYYKKFQKNPDVQTWLDESEDE